MLKVSCRCGGMADAKDSKSFVGDNVWVQVPPPAPNETNPNRKVRIFLFGIIITSFFTFLFSFLCSNLF